MTLSDNGVQWPYAEITKDFKFKGHKGDWYQENEDYYPDVDWGFSTSHHLHSNKNASGYGDRGSIKFTKDGIYLVELLYTSWTEFGFRNYTVPYTAYDAVYNYNLADTFKGKRVKGHVISTGDKDNINYDNFTRDKIKTIEGVEKNFFKYRNANYPDFVINESHAEEIYMLGMKYAFGGKNFTLNKEFKEEYLNKAKELYGADLFDKPRYNAYLEHTYRQRASVGDSNAKGRLTKWDAVIKPMIASGEYDLDELKRTAITTNMHDSNHAIINISELLKEELLFKWAENTKYDQNNIRACDGHLGGCLTLVKVDNGKVTIYTDPKITDTSKYKSNLKLQYRMDYFYGDITLEAPYMFNGLSFPNVPDDKEYRKYIDMINTAKDNTSGVADIFPGMKGGVPADKLNIYFHRYIGGNDGPGNYNSWHFIRLAAVGIYQLYK